MFALLRPIALAIAVMGASVSVAQVSTPPFPAGFAKGAYRATGDVVAAALRTASPAIVPATAAAKGVNGIVEVLAVVGTDGSVTAARALTTLEGLAEVRTEAEAAAKRHVFAPGTKAGVPVPVVVTIFVPFTQPGLPRSAAPAQGGSLDPAGPVPPAFARGASMPSADVIRPLPTTKVYPSRPSARRASGAGDERAEFLVRLDESGKISDVRLTSAAGPDSAEAEKALRQWAFEPAIKAGKPVALVMTVFIQF